MLEEGLICIRRLPLDRASGPATLVVRLDSVRLDKTRNGDPYADLRLTDLTGSIRGFLWSSALGFPRAGELVPGDVLLVRGQARANRDAFAFHLQDFQVLAEGRPRAEGGAEGPWTVLSGRRLVFDIETVPHASIEELPPKVADRVRVVAEREGGDTGKVLSLSPLLGRVICLGFEDLDDPGVRLALAVPHRAGLFSEQEPDGVHYLPGEKPLLEAFWQVAAEVSQLVSFNGRRFDVPFLVLRAAVHGVGVTRDLLGSRFSGKPHLDLIDLVTSQGALRGPTSLDVCCHAFGIPTPKGDLDGSQVARAFAEGRIDEIARYCLADVAATATLYRRLGAALIAGEK